MNAACAAMCMILPKVTPTEESNRERNGKTSPMTGYAPYAVQPKILLLRNKQIKKRRPPARRLRFFI